MRAKPFIPYAGWYAIKETKPSVSQKFRNILLMLGTIRRILMLLSMSWKWTTTLERDVLSSFKMSFSYHIYLNDLQHGLRFNRFRPTDFNWSSKCSPNPAKFLQWSGYYIDINSAFTFSKIFIFWFLLWCYGPVRPHKA